MGMQSHSEAKKVCTLLNSVTFLEQHGHALSRSCGALIVSVNFAKKPGS